LIAAIAGGIVMKVRLIVTALAVVVSLATPAFAADPDASVAPDTQAVIEKLGSAEHSDP
jgi:hypothetical protein